ncbi:MAG: aminotransferase class IV, partial [Balneolaceae bacterium]
MQVYLNGSYLDRNDAKISVSDRGFLFGDAIYEVIRSVNGFLFREKEHLERLKEGLTELNLKLDKPCYSHLPEIFKELLKRNDLLNREATIYVQITRGAA